MENGSIRNEPLFLRSTVTRNGRIFQIPRFGTAFLLTGVAFFYENLSSSDETSLMQIEKRRKSFGSLRSWKADTFSNAIRLRILAAGA